MRLWRVTLAAFVAVLFAVVGNIAAGMVSVAAMWKPWVWGAAALLGGAVVIFDIRRDPSNREAAAGGRVGLAQAESELIEAVRAQWGREEERRRLQDPVPLPVCWHLMSDALVDHWANIRRSPAKSKTGQTGRRRRSRRRPAPSDQVPLALTGDLGQVVDVYRQIPSGRLVVLGGAGSGKTVLTMRFVLDMLDARGGAEPVPVIFSLGSWDPAATSLRDWLGARLVRDYPGLAASGPTGSSLAAALVSADRILPVLDGFDEIAEGLHRAALEALNGTTMPLLLTSRPKEYSSAIKATDVLTSAAGIELDDLAPADLADYLPRTTRKTTGDGTNVWDPILAYLDECPDDLAASNLAKVLSTPLMVALARAIYSDTPENDPADLLDVSRFPSAQDLEDHLLDAFVPALYQRLPAERTSGHVRARHWDADCAQRYLGYLACHLNRLDKQDLAWWELGDAMPRSERLLACAAVGGLICGSTSAFIGALLFGWQGVLTVGLIGWIGGEALTSLLTGYRTEGQTPTFVQLRVRGRARGAVWQIWRRVRSTLVFGFGLGLLLGLVPSLGGERIWIAFALTVVPAMGLAIGLAGGFETPIDIRTAVSPSDLLRTSRWCILFQLLVYVLVEGLLTGLIASSLRGFIPLRHHVVGTGTIFGVAMWIALWSGLVFVLSGPWGRWFMISRCWLPVHRRLPWPVIAFLDDAYKRGALRQVGAVYQFRHSRLQSHLASFYEGRGG